MASSRVFLLAFLGVVAFAAAACTESSPASPAAPADDCERLARCCEALAGPVADQCRSTLDQYEDHAGAADACKSALSTFEASNACAISDEPGATDGGASPSSDAGHAGSAHAACDAYVACIAGTTPEGLAAIAAAYGPNGSCWAAADASVCEKACLTGLRNTRKVYPDAAACPECLGDADCAGSPGGPACDAKSGRCVACTSSAQCNGGVCDGSSHACVRCLADSDCPADAHRCKKAPGAANACVACLSGADCATGACDDGKCCQPETCGELKAIWGISSSTWICGKTYSTRCGGATIDCGGCTRGTCTSTGGAVDRCSLEDTPCTPGTSGTCLGDEVCAYVPNEKGYFCSYDLRGTTCAYGADSYKCGEYHFDCVGANLVQNGVCRSYCLGQADCAAGEKCSIYSELGYGVCE